MASHYTRDESNGVVRFLVVPNAYPMPGRVTFVFWAGVFLIVFGVPMLVFCVGAFFIAFGIWAVVMSKKLKAKYAEEQEKRRPVEVTVDAMHVASSRGGKYPIADIAEFQTGNTERTYQRSSYVTSHGQEFQEKNAERIAQALHDASWQACVRLRSDSRLWSLADGLDRQTAEALISDLALEVGRQARSA